MYFSSDQSGVTLSDIPESIALKIIHLLLTTSLNLNGIKSCTF